MKQITPQKLIWLDLEMTGLEPTRDRILEVAAIVTDWNFTELAVFESGVGHEPATIRRLLDKNEFYKTLPQNKKALLELTAASPAEKRVEEQLIALVNAHFGADEPVLLAGNSIHLDRRFIKQWWPKFDARLHYRMLDVSAWKVVMLGKYDVEFPKTESHRALGDIRESIAELQFYLQKAAF